jgi:hypothetical protein
MGRDLSGVGESIRLQQATAVEEARLAVRNRTAAINLTAIVRGRHPDDPDGPDARAEVLELLRVLGLAKPARRTARRRTPTS